MLLNKILDSKFNEYYSSCFNRHLFYAQKVCFILCNSNLSFFLNYQKNSLQKQVSSATSMYITGLTNIIKIYFNMIILTYLFLILPWTFNNSGDKVTFYHEKNVHNHVIKQEFLFCLHFLMNWPFLTTLITREWPSNGGLEFTF